MVCAPKMPVESELQKALASVLLHLQTIASALSDSTSSIEKFGMDLERNVKKLTEKIVYGDDMERRKNNVIFKGKGLAADSSDESASNTLAWVKTILTKMGLEGALVERAERVGRYRPNYNRPVLCTFSRYTDKSRAMKSRCSLRGTDVWINHDLPYEVRMEERRVREEKKQQSADRSRRGEREEEGGEERKEVSACASTEQGVSERPPEKESGAATTEGESEGEDTAAEGDATEEREETTEGEEASDTDGEEENDTERAVEKRGHGEDTTTLRRSERIKEKRKEGQPETPRREEDEDMEEMLEEYMKQIMN